MARARTQEIPPEFMTPFYKVIDIPYDSAYPGTPGASWAPNTHYPLGATLIERTLESTPPGLWYRYTCTTPGLSHPTTEPAWPAVGIVVDNQVTWTTGAHFINPTLINRKARSPYAAPAHAPTPKALAIREAFRRATKAVGHMTTTEKRAWFLKTLSSGREYWNVTAQDWIQYAYWSNEDESEWLYPRTCVSEPEWADQFPDIKIWYPNMNSFVLHFVANFGPGTNRYNAGARWPNVTYYLWDRCSFDPVGYSEWSYILKPTVENQWHNRSFILPNHDDGHKFLWRRISFTKQIMETDRQCWVWKFMPRDVIPGITYELTAFWGPENPYPL